MKKITKNIVLALFILLTVMLLIVPLISVVTQSIFVENRITLENYFTVFTNPYYSTTLLKTIRLAVVSSISALLIALMIVFIFRVYFIKQYQKLLLISNLFMNFSGVQLAFAFIILFGNTGIINLLLEGFGTLNIYGEAGLTTVYIYFQIPFAVILLMPVFEGLNEQWLQASVMLKASPVYTLKKVYLPIIMPSLTTIFILLFANAMSAFVTPYALVGNNYGIFIIRMANLVSGDVVLNPNLASAMAVILMIILLVMLGVGRIIHRKDRRYEVNI